MATKSKPTPQPPADPKAPPKYETRPYKVGDGDATVQVQRPGSCHKHLKSFGNLT